MKLFTITSNNKTAAHTHFIIAAGSRAGPRIIGWGIRFKLQMLWPQEDE